MRKGSKWSPEQRAKIQPHMHRGWKHDEETKRKIGLGNTGKIRSEVTKKKLSEFRLSRPDLIATATERIRHIRPPAGWKPPVMYGEANPSKRPEVREKISKKKKEMWASLPKRTDPKLRTTSEYRKFRMRVLVRDDFTCQVCRSKPSVKDLVVDHTKPFSLYPELITDLTNGRVLCKACHLKTPTYGTRLWR